MSRDHSLQPDDLDAYALGQLGPEEVVSILLAELEVVSARHRRMIRRWRKRHPEGERPSDRFVRRLEALRDIHPVTMEDARRRLDEIGRLPAGQRVDEAVKLGRSWNQRLLVLAALDRVETCFPHRLDQADEEMDVAHALVMSLGAKTPHGHAWRAGAHVRLLVYKALRLNVTHRVEEARRYVDCALTLARGVDDRRTLALLRECEGAVLRNQGRPGEAVDRLVEAADHWSALADDTSRGRTLLLMAETMRTGGRFEEALTTLRQALSLVDRDAEPYLFLCCEMTRCLLLCEVGEPEGAAALVDQHQDLLERFADARLVPYRLAVLQGRIDFVRGAHRNAVQHFEEARALALEHGRWIHAACVSLDVALALLHLGDTEALRDEVKAITPILAAEGLQHEPAVALSLYRDALLSERLTRDLARRFRSYFHLATHNPHLPFRRGEGERRRKRG